MDNNFGIKLLKTESKLLNKTTDINKGAKNYDQCLISYNKAVENNEPEQLTLF